jgi:hypothetical protein
MRFQSLVANLSVGIVLVAAATAQAQNRSPARYTCVAAKKLAVVGAWARDGVLIVERPHDQECRFSINGAPAGAPPLDRVVAGWELIAHGGWTLDARFPVDELGNALSAASPYDTIAPGLTEAIQKKYEGTPRLLRRAGRTESFCSLDGRYDLQNCYTRRPWPAASARLSWHRILDQVHATAVSHHRQGHNSLPFPAGAARPAIGRDTFPVRGGLRWHQRHLHLRFPANFRTIAGPGKRSLGA